MEGFLELLKYNPLAVLLLICAMYYAVKWLILSPPQIIRALAEARCKHEWEWIRHGEIRRDIGKPDETVVGYYQLYRCKKCGASRQY